VGFVSRSVVDKHDLVTGSVCETQKGRNVEPRRLIETGNDNRAGTHAGGGLLCSESLIRIGTHSCLNLDAVRPHRVIASNATSGIAVSHSSCARPTAELQPGQLNETV
jgi:hypothetical protein